MPFDWRASPQTAQMFGPSGMLAPFYARRGQQFQLLQQQQQRQFQEKQQQAAFDYSKSLVEYRQRLAEGGQLFKPQLQAAEAEAGQATMQAQEMGRLVDLQTKVRGLQEAGRWDEAADVWQAGQMPQAAQAPEMQYLLSPEGETLAQVPGAFKVAREPAGAAGAGALTPSQALTGQNQSISRFGAELDKRPASKIIQKRTGGKKTLNEFFALFSGKYTSAKKDLLDKILVEMIEKGDVPEGTTIESHPILSVARNLLEFGKVIAGEQTAPALGGGFAPGLGGVSGGGEGLIDMSITGGGGQVAPDTTGWQLPGVISDDQLEAAIEASEETYDQWKKRTKGGMSPEAQKVFEQNRQRRIREKMAAVQAKRGFRKMLPIFKEIEEEMYRTPMRF